ncbi:MULTISPECIES: DUF2934 domain-containing protein [Bradyrhizobium]
MSGPTEEEIRTKAYQLWRFVGEPACKMDKFWNQAENTQGAGRSAAWND